MAFMQVFDIAASGMSAQAIRLNTITSNLSNASSVAKDQASAYRAREPVFVPSKKTFGASFDEALAASAQGVEVAAIVESAAPLRQEYRPDHPFANDQGYVTLSNVNPIEEMANMVSASRAYQTNVQVMDTGKQMILSTLRLGQ